MRPQHMPEPQPAREAPPPEAMVAGLMGPFDVTFASGPDAPAASRAALSAWMTGHAGDMVLADAQLVVTELVANSVRHADAPADAVITVRAEVRGDILRLEVADRGDAGSIAPRTPDLHYGGGFGLHVVEVLSRRWGVNRGAVTRVWAELDFAATG
jgi:serine/threonine-protein kinase RsbW